MSKWENVVRKTNSWNFIKGNDGGVYEKQGERKEGWKDECVQNIYQ